MEFYRVSFRLKRNGPLYEGLYSVQNLELLRAAFEEQRRKLQAEGVDIIDFFASLRNSKEIKPGLIEVEANIPLSRDREK